MGKIVLLSTPANLGLRLPEVSSVPGCSKAPEALREAGLYRFFIEMGGIDGGATIPDQFIYGYARFHFHINLNGMLV